MSLLSWILGEHYSRLLRIRENWAKAVIGPLDGQYTGYVLRLNASMILRVSGRCLQKAARELENGLLYRFPELQRVFYPVRPATALERILNESEPWVVQ